MNYIQSLFGKRALGVIAISMLPMLAFAGCGDKPAENPDPDPLGLTWAVSPLDFNFEAEGGQGEIKIEVTAGEGMKFENATVTVADNGTDWITASRSNNSVTVTVDRNYNTFSRFAPVTVEYDGTKRNVVVNQKASAGKEDKLITIIGATGTSEETGSTPRLFSHSYDGDMVSHFNSKFGEITEWPFLLEYTLQTPNKLDYLVYYPRTESNQWGSFNKFDVYITTESNPEKVKIASRERGDGIHTPCRITLDEPVENVKTVSFEIRSAYQNRVSCAEMEFHEITGSGFDYTAIFADNLCTGLRPGITAQDVRKMPEGTYKTVAYAMLAGTYDDAFRVAEYRPYQHPSVMASSNRIPHAYSLRDNPTGIYVDADEELTVLVEDTRGQELSLVIQNLELGWSASRTFILERGENKFTAPISGLLYVMNHTNDAIPLILESESNKAAAAAKTVKIHFLNAKVQGYYRKGITTMEQWNKIISEAKYREIDIVSDYAHLTWLTEQFKAVPQYIDKSVENLDGLVWQQQEFCGLVKYDKVFRNRMYMMHQGSGAASATMYRTNYNTSYGEIFTTPERFSARLWVLGHEVGHINQVGLRWAGTTEVSNNIYSLYNQQRELGVATRLTSGSYDNERVWNGTTYPDIYETAIAAFVTAGNPQGADLSPDSENLEHWLKLVSFWQLQLYVADALGKTDFYADVFEYYRTCTPAANTLSHGEQQLLFTEICCKSAGLDLTAYFEKWGYFRPIDRVINDYGDKRMTITQEQIAATKARIAAAGYPAPPHSADRIIAIRDTNVNEYK